MAAGRSTKPVTGNWHKVATGEFNWPAMARISGLRFGTGNARIKDTDENDVLIVEINAGATVAGVFTQNVFCAAPVSLSKKHLALNAPRYLVVNSGNANACTGARGHEDALHCCHTLASLAGVQSEEILPFSTGVIGEPLPADKIARVLPQAFAGLSADNWLPAAKAIMTTDTRPKGASETLDIDGVKVSVTGIAKGSGMIKPNMATMLAYVATDAAIEKNLLETLCQQAVSASFNRITIDGDTSTNDACILIASGKETAVQVTDAESPAYQKIAAAVSTVFLSLARQIVMDGEGATKFIEIQVKNGNTPEECLIVAYEIAHSPLVKTAFFASDPNWGRIVAAIGKAPIKNVNAEKIRVWLNDLLVVENATHAAAYTEKAGQAEMNKPAITVIVDLAQGDAQERIWTSDLSHGYVTINADYRS